VLDAALELFVELGYPGTSMERIADAAGVTKPVVYECYPSKPELFAALLDREEQRLLEGVLAALPRELDAGDIDDVVTNGFVALLRGAAAAPKSWRVVFDAQYGTEPAVVRRVEWARARVSTQVEHLVGAFLVQSGVEDPARRAAVTAGLLIAVGEASVRMMLSGTGEWTPDELASFVARFVMHGARRA
jgi:AcrR family transcriptional regulator